MNVLVYVHTYPINISNLEMEGVHEILKTHVINYDVLVSLLPGLLPINILIHVYISLSLLLSALPIFPF